MAPPSDTFNPSRGIWKGDPLSPFLFILATKHLGRSLKFSILSSSLKGIWIHIDLEPLSHLFIDDTLLSSYPTIYEALSLKKVLNSFMLAFKPLINHNKSQIFFFNTPLTIQNNITNLLVFQRHSLPSKYLGAPFLVNALRNAPWEDLLSKIEDKLNSWTFCYLNLLGKITLLKSVLQSMPFYLFYVFVDFSKISKAIGSLHRDFLWGSWKRP